MRRPKPNRPATGQRSVWDFPRPPAVEVEPKRVSAIFAGLEIAASSRCVRVLETSHPPVFFFPPEDVRTDLLERSERASFCEWKGRAVYYDLVVKTEDGMRRASDVGFHYPVPPAWFVAHARWISFYAGPLDACYVGDERAEAQPGGFYSGWVTSGYAGPFKGVPGSAGW